MIISQETKHHQQHGIDFLLYAKHSAKYFIFIILFISTITGEETGARHG